MKSNPEEASYRFIHIQFISRFQSVSFRSMFQLVIVRSSLFIEKSLPSTKKRQQLYISCWTGQELRLKTAMAVPWSLKLLMTPVALTRLISASKFLSLIFLPIYRSVSLETDVAMYVSDHPDIPVRCFWVAESFRIVTCRCCCVSINFCVKD